MTDFLLWDDNPSEVDLLGFDAVVAPVVQAIAAHALDPVTIGIHGPWGSGKSTVLRLIEDAIPSDSKYLVVRTDPWEYDDHADVKGTVIAEILGALEEEYGETARIGVKTKNLLKRISWSRATIALASGAVTMQWDPDKVVKAFTPKTKEEPDSMTGFRGEFAQLLEDLDLDRVVVLVDDLDRCLPSAVTATFEAIKLFLSVPKMVFIIAADQDMVRDAIAVSVDSASRGDRFASRYLDKIIQLPVSLPRLAPHEAEAYTALLLARSENPETDQFNELVAHCGERRRSHTVPLVGNLGSLSWRPSDIVLSLAAQLAQGMGGRQGFESARGQEILERLRGSPEHRRGALDRNRTCHHRKAASPGRPVPRRLRPACRDTGSGARGTSRQVGGVGGWRGRCARTSRDHLRGNSGLGRIRTRSRRGRTRALYHVGGHLGVVLARHGPQRRAHSAGRSHARGICC